MGVDFLKTNTDFRNSTKGSIASKKGSQISITDIQPSENSPNFKVQFKLLPKPEPGHTVISCSKPNASIWSLWNCLPSVNSGTENCFFVKFPEQQRPITTAYSIFCIQSGSGPNFVIRSNKATPIWEQLTDCVSLSYLSNSAWPQSNRLEMQRIDWTMSPDLR